MQNSIRTLLNLFLPFIVGKAYPHVRLTPLGELSWNRGHSTAIFLSLKTAHLHQGEGWCSYL